MFLPIAGDAAPQWWKCFRHWRFPVAAFTAKNRPRNWLTNKRPYPTTGGNSMMLPVRSVQIFRYGGRTRNWIASCVRAGADPYSGHGTVSMLATGRFFTAGGGGGGGAGGGRARLCGGGGGGGGWGGRRRGPP